MKLPYWITEYSPLSSAQGQIESLIVILPSKAERGTIELHTPLLKTLNSTHRTVVRFYNDFSHLNAFWSSENQDRKGTNSSGSVQPGLVNDDEHREVGHEKNWEDAPRYFNPNELKCEYHDDLDWEDNTRYFEDAAPNNRLSSISSRAASQLVTQTKQQNMGIGPGPDQYHPWVQDPFYCLQKYDSRALETTLLFSILSPRFEDLILPLELAQNPALNLRCHPADLLIEGGNMLVIDKVMFIGKELIEKNVKLFNDRDSREEANWDSAEITQLFKEQFNVYQVIVLGTEKKHISFDIDKTDGNGKCQHRLSYQPFFHIDLYLNFGGISPLSGKRIVFMGCPQYGMDILNGKDDSIDCNLGHPHQDKNSKGAAYKIGQLFEETAIFFNDLQDQLEYEGLEVVKVPMYVFSEPISRRYSVCSWNNALVEIYNAGKSKHIYLPTYEITKRKDRTGHSKRIKVLEEKVKQIYIDNGFNVHVIEAANLFRSAIQKGGSLHCMVKVLGRKES